MAVREQTAVELALNWLAQSNVRHTSGPARGGVNQGYNWQQQSYTLVYSQATGSAISLFVAAYRWTGDPHYVALAHDAAYFLLRAQENDPEAPIKGAIPSGLSLPDLDVVRQYASFDAAMCLQGLTDLYRVSPSAHLLDAARAIGDWLITQMQQDNGAFLALIDAETGVQFSHDFGCWHGKHAIGLLKLSQITGDQRYETAARKVCDWVLTLQNDDGSFRAGASSDQLITHAHCCALEGLLYAHFALDDEQYLHAALRGAEWLLDVQNRDGSINAAYKQDWLRRRLAGMVSKKVTDATAQAARLFTLLYWLDGDSRWQDGARHAADFVREMQADVSADANAAGGFYASSGHSLLLTGASLFATQALYEIEHLHNADEYMLFMEELV